MGYTTDFEGIIMLDKPLTQDQMKILHDFSRKDHRDEPWAKKLGLIWCQWEPTEDGEGIVWDGGEKFYDYGTWMEVIMDKFIKPWGLTANGTIKWQGESMGDAGILKVTNNEVSMYNIFDRAYQIEDALDKVLSLVPTVWPLLMGINPAMDQKVQDLLKGD